MLLVLPVVANSLIRRVVEPAWKLSERLIAVPPSFDWVSPRWFNVPRRTAAYLVRDIVKLKDITIKHEFVLTDPGLHIGYRRIRCNEPSTVDE